MLSEIFFVIKVFAISLLVVGVMKLEWDGRKVEDRVRFEVIEAQIMPFLKDVAHGAYKAIGDLQKKINNNDHNKN